MLVQLIQMELGEQRQVLLLGVKPPEQARQVPALLQSVQRAVIVSQVELQEVGELQM